MSIRNISRMTALMLSAVIFASCAGNGGSKGPIPFPKAEPLEKFMEAQKNGTAETDASELPSANDIALHYWDRYLDSTRESITDSSMIAGVPMDSLNLALVTYVEFLKECNYDQVETAHRRFADQLAAFLRNTGDQQAAGYILGKFRRVFYDGDSPYRNDELTYSLCSRMLELNVLDSINTSSMKFMLERIDRNRLHQPVKDFAYMTISGKEGRLYDLKEKKAEYTLLVFGSVNCPACTQTLDVIEQSALKAAVEDGKVNVLVMYTDEDIPSWKEYIGGRPDAWIKAFDHIMVLDDLYDLKAIPTVYLLDKEMNLVLKDVDIMFAGGYLLSKGMFEQQ